MKLWPVLLVSLAAAIAGEAQAYETVCSSQDFQRYHYGVKARLQFASPPDRAAALMDALQSYSVSGLHMTGGHGFTDSSKTPPLTSRSESLMSASNDVTITAETTSRDDIVRISIKTFSYSWGATEDWRPYWRDFRVFIARWRRA